MNLYINDQLVAPALGSVTLQKSRNEASATLTAVLYTAPADTYFLDLSLALGDPVYLLDDSGTKIFVGSIHELERATDALTLTAYDAGIYLARNELAGIFCGTNESIIRTVAAQLALSLGTIEAVSGRHTIMTYAGQSAFSILKQVVGPGREIRLENNTLSVIRQTANQYTVTVDQVLQISSRADIGQMVNKSIVTDYKGATLAAAQQATDISAYGQFQSVFLKDGSNPVLQAQSKLKGRAFSADVTLFGQLNYRCNDVVIFGPNDWGLSHRYLISAISHRWKAGLFTTELTLEGLDT